ncbi:MAG TPA: hypothetical protein VF179_23395, partial [Thermoanaerobaculia bacterium]|nr:hypothetical protein [Thermoanaerobaculia bacterium]
ERGSLRLGHGGASLRIVGPSGSVEHARSFLPGSGYSPVSALVLRKADGTGLFIFPAGDATAAAVSHRLRWTYHRVPETGRPFSQAGDRSVERVAIDLP